MRRLAWALLVLPLAAGPGAAEEVKRKPEIALEIHQRLQDRRLEAGAPRAERRMALEEAALARALEIAARPVERRLQQERPIEDVLEAAGVVGYLRAREHVEVQQGYPEAADAALGRWRGARDAWDALMNPAVDALAVSAVTAGDGWLVLVVLLLEDLEVPPDLAVWERKLQKAVNRIRAERRLRRQSTRPDLDRVARRHSEDMARRAYFAHVSPEGYGLSQRIVGLRLRYIRIAENIARNQGMDDPVQVAVDRWMKSPSHRRNLLDPDFTETGAGVAVDARGMIYFTQIYLQPPEPAGGG